jgi:Major Facilitator Superfamily/Ion channel regulatory protein UNC-93
MCRYATYSISGLLGSTYVVKEVGSRNALVCGMALYCAYVSAFWVATIWRDWQTVAAAMGGVLGGVGAGFLWTAQGAYFAQSAASASTAATATTRTTSSSSTSVQHDVPEPVTEVVVPETLTVTTAHLASTFAVIYLGSEVGLRAASSILVTLGLSWSAVFAMYAIVAVASTMGMGLVHNFDRNDDHGHRHRNGSLEMNRSEHDEADPTARLLPAPVSPPMTATAVPPMPSAWYKATAAWRLLRHDRKMPLMIGLNAVFGITSSFLTSYINGQVVYAVMGSDVSVGLWTAWVSTAAAAGSALCGRLAPRTGNGPILMAGAVCFAAVAAPFVLFPNVATQWTWPSLLFVYTVHGLGRATFESTLKATFADFFAESDKEGAFANIIFQNGLSSTVGFLLTFALRCTEKHQSNAYCVVYRDGSVHDVLSFEILIVVTSVVAIVGYWRAAAIRAEELRLAASV